MRDPYLPMSVHRPLFADVRSLVLGSHGPGKLPEKENIPKSG